MASADAGYDRLMSIPGSRPDYRECDGCSDRRWRGVLEWPGLRCLAQVCAAAISTGDRTILGKIIEARQSLSARAVRTGSLGHTCKGEASRWEGHGLKPWIEAAKRRLHRNVLA